jgi:type I restriction enzyme, S subunit
MNRVPEDWRTIRLADAGRWLSGGTPNTSFSAYWNGVIPWISAASLKDFNITDSDRRVTPLGARSGTRIIPRNTVLFVVRGMSLKNEFRVGITRHEVTFGQDCKAILPGTDIDPTFLAYSLKANADRVLAMVDEAGHGTGRLPTDQLAALTIGVPGIAEQRQIAEILDSLEKSIRSTEQVIGKLRTTRRALLTDIFRTDSWPALRLAEAVRISSGGTPSRSITSFWRDGTVAWVKTGEVCFSTITGTKERVTPDAVTASRLRVYPPGTVLVAMYGQGATRGRVGILGVPATINQACAALQCDTTIMKQEFLYHQLAQSYDELRRLGHGSQQTNLNAELLGHVIVKAPSLDQQDLVVGRIQQFDRRIDAEVATLRKTKLLRQGLMDDLLTGRVRVNVGEDLAA